MDKWMFDLVRIQFAVLEGWMNVWNHYCRAWRHLTALNLELMHHPAFHRWHNVIPSGAKWTNHYGRRQHDVDVEHMR